MFFNLSDRLEGSSSKIHLSVVKQNAPPVLFSSEFVFFRPSYFKDCSIIYIRWERHRFPIETVPAFGMSSLLYAARHHYPDGRTYFVWKPKMVIFLETLTQVAPSRSHLLSFGFEFKSSKWTKQFLSHQIDKTPSVGENVL